MRANLIVAIVALPAFAQITATQVSIQGDTTGKSEFRASGGGFVPVGNFGQLVFRASYRTAISEGTGTLLTAAPDKLSLGTNWEVGGTASLLVFHEEVDRAKAHRAAWEACAGECANQPDSTFCKWSTLETAKAFAEYKRTHNQKLTLCSQVSAETAKLDQAEARIKAMSGGPDQDDAWARLAAKRGELLVKCTTACDDPFAEKDDSFCQQREQQPTPTPLPAVIDAVLCEDGRKALRATGFVRPKFPSAMVNLGGRGGAKQVTFLSSVDGMPYAKEEKLFGQWAAGASAWKFIASEADRREGWTIEAVVSFATRFEPSSTSVRACVPSGSLTVSDGTTAPLENCNDFALGRPKRSTVVRAAFFGGILNSAKDYRIALGVDSTISFEGATSTALAMPITLKIAGGDKYKGLVRVTPSVAINTSANKPPAPVFGVTLSLLGQRDLFTEDFDRL